MAYRENATNEYLTDNTLFYEFDHFWAIHRSVGWGSQNNYDDVMLIQYLINSLKITEKLEEDGLFGPKTSKAIWRFQNKFNQKHKACCIADGKVNAVKGDVLESSRSETIYTIYLLNYWYLQKKRIYYTDIRMDPELPNELCHLLSV
jgi:hypothetical protein